MEDIRFEGRTGRLGAVMTVVVVDGPKGKGKEYRLPTDHERAVAEVSEEQLEALYADIPFGLPEEQTPKAGIGASRAFSVDGYGFDTWRKLFTNRQLLALGGFVLILRKLMQELDGWPENWREGLIANLALVNDRLADYSSAVCSWHNSGEKLGHTFARFALPIVWDYTEVNPLSDSSGNYLGALDWVSRCIAHVLESAQSAETTSVQNISATGTSGKYDAIVTDPPYYDAIPYSDLMDFFYVWLRRSILGLSAEIETVFSGALGPKWDHDTDDGELIDDAGRFGGDRERSKQNYEDGMARSFRSCHTALQPDGRLVVVFANKHPDAWETLVAAPDSGRFRRGWFLAHTDGDGHSDSRNGLRRSLLLRLDRLQKAPLRSPRLGHHRPQRNARQHHPATPRLLGRWHSRPRLRMGRNRPGPRSLQQAPRSQEGQRPQPTNVRLGVPARSAAHGRRFRRRPRADPRTATKKPQPASTT